ncbi:pescadillo-like isoform X2 [Branchiostoma floridae]|uniref:Pescadillo homolog n=1 Tax=Branchiostoma floridae TaxID=7739 RepID=A0A9J7M144_BRAFL|nr:pescadillo-like isoform X2 [Branchiostoma floridae]
MGRLMQKKYESGAATAYITRNRAINYLQISLPDFRRLCILKGVYPREPKNKKKANKGSTAPRTFYLMKDIQYLSHEPIINKFREFKVFVRKLKKAFAKAEHGRAQTLQENKPVYKLDHIIKERYPTFVDALRDLDDCLCLVFLFATFPQTKNIPGDFVQRCRHLSVEFMNFIVAARALRKVFLSIKGIYYQVEMQGQVVTWLVPYSFGFNAKACADVDFRVMAHFVEFYITMLGFVNFKLYTSLGLHYPPKLTFEAKLKDDDEKNAYCLESEATGERLAALSASLASVVTQSTEEDEVELDEFEDSRTQEAKQEEEKEKAFQKLFNGLKVFVSREVPREPVVFAVRSFGGEASWDRSVAMGAAFDESDETITHQIVDRPKPDRQYLSRYYIQPQWLFDCVNAKMLLPVEDYFPGVVLPPHLSPFVEYKEGDYVPPEKEALSRRQQGLDTGDAVAKEAEDSEEEDENEEEEGQEEEDEEIDDEDQEEEEVEDEDDDDEDDDEEEDEDEEEEEVQKVEKKTPLKRKQDDVSDTPPSSIKVKEGKLDYEDASSKANREEWEARKLAIMMIPKKRKRLFEKLSKRERRKKHEAKKLTAKREEFEKSQKTMKKKQRLSNN